MTSPTATLASVSRGRISGASNCVSRRWGQATWCNLVGFYWSSYLFRWLTPSIPFGRHDTRKGGRMRVWQEGKW
jgi:hypothetical protein